jgi:hypothetical protein
VKFNKIKYLAIVVFLLLFVNASTFIAMNYRDTDKTGNEFSVSFNAKMDLAVNEKEDSSILSKMFFDNIDKDSNIHMDIFQNPIYYFPINNSLVLIEDQNRVVLRFADYLRS